MANKRDVFIKVCDLYMKYTDRKIIDEEWNKLIDEAGVIGTAYGSLAKRLIIAVLKQIEEEQSNDI